MKGYQAGISQFTDSDSVVFGVSTDPLQRNKEFAESLNLEFALLSDEDGAVSKKFGIYNAERNMSSPHHLRHRQERQDRPRRVRRGRDRPDGRGERLQQAVEIYRESTARRRSDRRRVLPLPGAFE